MAEPIVGVILAAGSSSRLGRTKQLEMVAGKPMIVHTIQRALQSSLDHLIVVVGAEEAKVRAVVQGLPVTIVSNPDHATGQASSVIAGVGHAETLRAEAIVFLLADQPGIEPVAIDRLVQARRTTGALVGMTRYGDQRAHPVMFGRELFPELVAITGDMGGRGIVQRHRDTLVLVDGGRNTVPADLDREGDLDAVKRDLHVADE